MRCTPSTRYPLASILSNDPLVCNDAVIHEVSVMRYAVDLVLDISGKTARDSANGIRRFINTHRSSYASGRKIQLVCFVSHETRFMSFRFRCRILPESFPKDKKTNLTHLSSKQQYYVYEVRSYSTYTRQDNDDETYIRVQRPNRRHRRHPFPARSLSCCKKLPSPRAHRCLTRPAAI